MAALCASGITYGPIFVYLCRSCSTRRRKEVHSKFALNQPPKRRVRDFFSHVIESIAGTQNLLTAKSPRTETTTTSDMTESTTGGLHDHGMPLSEEKAGEECHASRSIVVQVQKVEMIEEDLEAGRRLSEEVDQKT